MRRFFATSAVVLRLAAFLCAHCAAPVTAADKPDIESKAIFFFTRPGRLVTGDNPPKIAPQTRMNKREMPSRQRC